MIIIIYTVDGESATRMIKSTQNMNQNTPVIAVTAYEQTFRQTQYFDDVLSKPVTKDILLRVLMAIVTQRDDKMNYSNNNYY